MTSEPRSANDNSDHYRFDDRVWRECWQCFGEGLLDDCFEDTCVCVDPPCHQIRCDICGGAGGYHVPAGTPE